MRGGQLLAVLSQDLLDLQGAAWIRAGEQSRVRGEDASDLPCTDLVGAFRLSSAARYGRYAAQSIRCGTRAEPGELRIVTKWLVQRNLRVHEEDSDRFFLPLASALAEFPRGRQRGRRGMQHLVGT